MLKVSHIQKLLKVTKILYAYKNIVCILALNFLLIFLEAKSVMMQSILISYNHLFLVHKVSNLFNLS